MNAATCGSLTFAVLVLAGGTLFGEGTVPVRTAPSPNAQHLPALDLKPRSAEPLTLTVLSQHEDYCDKKISTRIRVDSGHPWRPPFGVDRVGASPVVHVELTSEQAPRREYYVVAYRIEGGSEQRSLNFERNPVGGSANKTTKDISPFFANALLTSIPREVALYARCPRDGQIEELSRRQVKWPEFEADVAARPDRQINPVDLGTILVPHGWLLLAGGQTALISAAAISHTRNVPNSRLRAWFEGAEAVEVGIPLAMNRRAAKKLELPLTSKSDSTVLHVSITDGDRELWKKEIRTMIVAEPPRWPTFGVVETKLRYDAPISVRDRQTGARSSMDYSSAWEPKFNDVVVFLPNGSRFVFWRGSNYIPFWAGRYNTAVCYQWAENLSQPVHHPDGTVDFPEPLYDHELRYGRVRIIESTPSRVHVRWTYQSTDVQYNVWGDQVIEDFYFYPDGFGTRSLTLTSAPGALYQLSEFIVLTPQSAFPFEVLPSHMADVLFLDGEKKRITVPLQPKTEVPAGKPSKLLDNPRQMPMVYRIFAHKDDPAAAIYFLPRDPTTPFAMTPLYDGGQLVTPVYWGSHWPLGRGEITRWAIDDRIYVNPAHNSLGGWLPAYHGLLGSGQPEPLSTSRFQMLDTLGRSRDMMIRSWSWLIAKTDAPDDVLLEWAQSFSEPPSLDVMGARIDFPSYSSERRAMRLVAESPSIEIELKPAVRTVNPVFELDQAPAGLASVTIDGMPLPVDDYAWDGETLWMKASIDARGAKIGIRFR